jgi:hypothetical protein
VEDIHRGCARHSLVIRGADPVPRAKRIPIARRVTQRGLSSTCPR